MPKIVPIVEGPGDVTAVPKLLMKILHSLGRWEFQIAPAKNAHGCGNLTKQNGLERFVELSRSEVDCAAVIILIDADTGCAKEIATGFSKRLAGMGMPCSIATVVAKCEYEAWFLASLPTIAGKELDGRPGIVDGTACDRNVESIVGVKAWLSRKLVGHPNRIYKETVDQAPMTSLIDIALARRNSRSFRRLCHAVEEIVAAIDEGRAVITP